MKNNLLYIITPIVLIALLMLLTDPFMYWMPSMNTTLTLLGVTIIMLAFAGFVIKEEAGDERETMHRMNAGRIAYLLGLGSLTVGLLVEGISHGEINPWISLALGIMVTSKLAARWYFEKYH